jgi:phenylacetate-coenzyme A ligase PaaK-like adenylate-forming protein
VISNTNTLEDQLFEISSDEEFSSMALKIFRLQHSNLKIYKDFCDRLKINPSDVQDISSIPFLPIQFFKSHKVILDNSSPEIVFRSSGTTGTTPSKHYVHDLSLYEKSFIRSFEHAIAKIEDNPILALLPSYLERDGSSLVYMVNELINKSNSPYSGFYLDNIEELKDRLLYLESNKINSLLIGVSYALLDLIEHSSFQLDHVKVMETGGMKGRRKEMIKRELHQRLKKGFGVSSIYSEYGMTELLSQAYSKQDGIFHCPLWMKVMTRDTEDPLSPIEGKTGALNIIDLVNINSCSFIATQDLGKVYPDGSFEILGRFDDSDIRGCNLMYGQ